MIEATREFIGIECNHPGGTSPNGILSQARQDVGLPECTSSSGNSQAFIFSGHAFKQGRRSIGRIVVSNEKKIKPSLKW
jgi:hypothetical protein